MQASYTLDKFNSGRTVVGDAITELAKDDPRIWLLTPDIGWGCNDFKAAHPERFIDTGIAEQCVVGVSAGLALEGAIPFIIGMMPFMSMRDLEQVRTDLCYPNLPVRIIANYSGLTGNGGSTHYAMEDMALFSSLVNMTVCAPADPNQLKQICPVAGSATPSIGPAPMTSWPLIYCLNMDVSAPFYDQANRPLI